MEVKERRELLEVRWEGEDGLPLGVTFDRVGASGRLVRLWAGGGRDAPRVVFDGVPKYRAEVDRKVLTSRLQGVRWEVVRVDELKAELRLGTVVLGPLSGELVYTFFEGLSLFAEELRLRADAPVRLKSMERTWFGFRTGPGDNVFKGAYWKGGEGRFSCGGRRTISDSPFLYLWNGRLGLGVLCPQAGGEFYVEDRDDWTACAGLALGGSVEVPSGGVWTFPVVYCLGIRRPGDFEGLVDDLGIEGYRRLAGRRVLAVPVGDTSLRPGVDLVWGEDGPEGALRIGREVRAGSGCRRQGGRLPGRGLYIVPKGEVPEEGCLDLIAARVEEADGVTARLDNTDLSLRKIRDLWSPHIWLFGLSGEPEEIRRYETLLEQGLRVYMLGVGGLANYVEASGEDIRELACALREGRSFLTTGEIVATTYKAFDRELWLGLEWTFPIKEVQVRSEGEVLYREEPPPELSGKKGFTFQVEDRRWVRVEAIDVVGGRCLLQPIFREGEA